MGLSTKQVSSDHGLDWNQTLLQAQTLELPKPSPVSRRQQLQNMPAPEQLKCPRCDSSNTKFCYYNNYNKSQPRHFCKACKRHWTKGGTLRNVPVGGGRKNKRLKSSKNNPKTASKSSSTTAAAAGTNGNVLINRVSTNNPQIETMSQPTMFSPPYNFSGKTPATAGELDNSNNNSIFLGSSNFPHFSTSFEAINPCSISTSFQSPNVYNFTSSSGGDQAIDQDLIVTSILTNSTTNAMMPHQLNWQANNQNTTTSYWNWDDLDAFAAPTDLNIPWDDTEIKP